MLRYCMYMQNKNRNWLDISGYFNICLYICWLYAILTTITWTFRESIEIAKYIFDSWPPNKRRPDTWPIRVHMNEMTNVKQMKHRQTDHTIIPDAPTSWYPVILLLLFFPLEFRWLFILYAWASALFCTLTYTHTEHIWRIPCFTSVQIWSPLRIVATHISTPNFETIFIYMYMKKEHIAFQLGFVSVENKFIVAKFEIKYLWNNRIIL